MRRRVLDIPGELAVDQIGPLLDHRLEAACPGFVIGVFSTWRPGLLRAYLSAGKALEQVNVRVDDSGSPGSLPVRRLWPRNGHSTRRKPATPA